MNLPLARRIAGITFAALGTVALVTACGSSGKSSTPTNAAGGNGFQAYLTCLSSHGVTLPSRGPRPSNRPSEGPRPSRSPGSGFGGGGFGGGGFGGGFGGGGFGFTDPSQPPNGVDAATWSAAVAACKSLAPTANPSGRGFNNTAFAAYRNCLSDHGVTFNQGGGGGLNTADPKIAAALKACEPLRPTGRPTGAPTG